LKGRSKKSNGNILPQDPLERCHLRWHCLFWGCVRALNQYDPKLTVGLFNALEKTGGLTVSEDSLTFTGELFDLNPSDDILARAKAFYKNPKFPNLKWQRLPWEKINVSLLFIDYSSILHELNKFPPKFFNYRNINNKKSWLKDMLPLIFKHVSRHNKEKLEALSEITDWDLIKWARLSKKELAVNLVAHIYILTIPNTRKLLATARRKHPLWAKWWKHGLEMIESK